MASSAGLAASHDALTTTAARRWPTRDMAPHPRKGLRRRAPCAWDTRVDPALANADHTTTEKPYSHVSVRLRAASAVGDA
jgi:hypothetical protein